MNTFKIAAAFALLYAVAGATTALADTASESKLNDATRQVERGAKTTGDRMKEAGRAAEPEAKSAWEHVKDGPGPSGTITFPLNPARISDLAYGA